MNAAVSDEVLERHTRSLATDGVKAGEDNGLGRVINDEGDTGDLLERADVPTFSTDDAALEVVGRDVDGGNRDFAGLVCGTALNSS